jgi:hypothetical protein
MKIAQKYIRSESEPLGDIEAYLQGKVFHVTKLNYLSSIIECGEIKTNIKGELPSTFGVYNNFFKNRNCVSLFDYRPEPTEKINGFRHRCHPLQPARPPSVGVAILFLSQKIYDDLVPWTKWKEENALREMIVPHVEAGYPGYIPLELVTEIIAVEITEDPTSLAACLRRCSKKEG